MERKKHVHKYIDFVVIMMIEMQSATLIPKCIQEIGFIICMIIYDTSCKLLTKYVELMMD
jgi:hypothetical protein